MKCSFKQSIECLEIKLTNVSSTPNVCPPLTPYKSLNLTAISPVSALAIPVFKGLPLDSIPSTVPILGS